MYPRYLFEEMKSFWIIIPVYSASLVLLSENWYLTLHDLSLTSLTLSAWVSSRRRKSTWSEGAIFSRAWPIFSTVDTSIPNSEGAYSKRDLAYDDTRGACRYSRQVHICTWGGCVVARPKQVDTSMADAIPSRNSIHLPETRLRRDLVDGADRRYTRHVGEFGEMIVWRLNVAHPRKETGKVREIGNGQEVSRGNYLHEKWELYCRGCRCISDAKVIELRYRGKLFDITAK